MGEGRETPLVLRPKSKRARDISPSRVALRVHVREELTLRKHAPRTSPAMRQKPLHVLYIYDWVDPMEAGGPIPIIHTP